MDHRLTSLTKSHWRCGAPRGPLPPIIEHSVQGPELSAVFWVEEGVSRLSSKLLGCFQVAGYKPSSSARFTPCLLSTVRRKCGWKSPSLLQWGCSLPGLWACSFRHHRHYRQLLCRIHPLPGKQCGAEVRGTFSRNQGQWPNSQLRLLEEDCAIVLETMPRQNIRKGWKSYETVNVFQNKKSSFLSDYASNCAHWGKKRTLDNMEQ